MIPHPYRRAQNDTPSFKPEIIPLAKREHLEAFVTSDADKFHSAIPFALDANSHPWLLVQDDQFLALASWRTLPWDSEVLQCPSGAIFWLWAKGEYVEQCHRLLAVLKACITDAEQRNIRFLSLRLEEGALAALHAAEAVGFRIIESYLTFRRNTTEEILPEDSRVRLARPDEVEIVADLAFRAFQSYRYFVDPLIPEVLARHSRREWVRNAFQGRAEAIYIAENQNQVAGFVLLKSRNRLTGEKIGIIDLIAVDPQSSGQGIGKVLVAQAVRHYHGSASAIEVGTQGKNTRAVGLYTRMGFQMVHSEFSLHRHAESA